MEHLEENWYLKDPIDFELRKYELKAFLQIARTFYRQLNIYPLKGEVSDRKSEIQNLIDLERDLFNRMKSDLIGIDTSKLELIRKKSIKTSAYLDELGRIIEYALPILCDLEKEGEEIEEFVDANSSLETVGLEAIYKLDGYLMISNGNQSEIPVYRFKSGLLDSSKQPIIRFDFLTILSRSVCETFESLKRRMIKLISDFSVPATYLLVSEHQYPLQATLLPVARKKLIPVIID